MSGAAGGVATRAQLDALLTPLRARMLIALEHRRTMSELAQSVYIAPSTATYQVAVMRRAGLVERTKAMNTVVVERTCRGDALLVLYGIVARSPERGISR